MNRIYFNNAFFIVWLLLFPTGNPLFTHSAARPSALLQQPETAQDETIFKAKLTVANAKTALPAKALAVGNAFLNTPYVHGTLDKTSEEQLVVNLRELDCFTFVENCTAIALTSKNSLNTYQSYKNQLQQLRYWGGTVDGFGSRIHYFTGWILQQEKRGILQDITSVIGGVRYKKNTRYITSHPEEYPALSAPAIKVELEKAEKRINDHEWYYIPKAKVQSMEHFIHEGDIVATTSSRSDLDISHQGFAVRKNGRIYLMHASSIQKKVIISARPLAEYLNRNKSQSGIMVARLLD